MMTYYRTGKWPNIGLECTIEYLYNPEQKPVPAVLKFEPLGDYSPSDFEFRFPQSISDISSHSQIYEFTIPEDFTGGEIFVANKSCDNNIPQTQIAIITTRIFHILQSHLLQ